MTKGQENPWLKASSLLEWCLNKSLHWIEQIKCGWKGLGLKRRVMELLNYTVKHKISSRSANIIIIVVNRQKSKTLHTCLLTCNTSSTPRRNASLVRLLCSPTAKLSAFWTPSSLTSMLAGAPTIEPKPKPTATATSAARTTTLAFHILTRDDLIILQPDETTAFPHPQVT